MAVGKTTSNLGMMYIGFKAAFKKAFDAADPEDWRRLATLVPSTTAAELYAWLGAFPSLREWIGDRVIKQLERHDYTIRNRTFESTIQVRVDDVEGRLRPERTCEGREGAPVRVARVVEAGEHERLRRDVGLGDASRQQGEDGQGHLQPCPTRWPWSVSTPESNKP